MLAIEAVRALGPDLKRIDQLPFIGADHPLLDADIDAFSFLLALVGHFHKTTGPTEDNADAFGVGGGGAHHGRFDRGIGIGDVAGVVARHRPG